MGSGASKSKSKSKKSSSNQSPKTSGATSQPANASGATSQPSNASGTTNVSGTSTQTNTRHHQTHQTQQGQNRNANTAAPSSRPANARSQPANKQGYKANNAKTNRPVITDPSKLVCHKHRARCSECYNMWNSFQGGTNSPGVKILIAPPTPNLLDTVQDFVNSTWRSQPRMRIKQVYKVFNKALWTKYCDTKKELHKKAMAEPHRKILPIERVPATKGQPVFSHSFDPEHIGEMAYDLGVNEAYLFHGTPSKNVQGIMDNGFYRSTGGLYGGVVYLAESAEKSHPYTREGNVNLHMFMVRTTMGRSFIHTGNEHIDQLPCKRRGCMKTGCGNHEPFDSAVAGMSRGFREFLVYDSAMCFPQFLLVYDYV